MTGFPGRVPLEREVHHDVMIALRQLRCVVFNLAQGYRPGGKRHATTRQTEGLPDLYVFPPRGLPPFWIEVKRPGGQQRAAQAAFEQHCMWAGVPYVLGGLRETLDHLRSIGVIAGTPQEPRAS